MTSVANRITNIIGTIVYLALVTVLVSSPETSRIIASVGTAFSGALRAAMGRDSR